MKHRVVIVGAGSTGIGLGVTLMIEVRPMPIDLDFLNFNGPPDSPRVAPLEKCCCVGTGGQERVETQRERAFRSRVEDSPLGPRRSAREADLGA